MNSKEIVRLIMKKRGHSYASLAEKLGKKDKPNHVAERLRGSTEMRVDTLVKFLKEMDCKLIIHSNIGDKEDWEITLDEVE